jgi:phosphohistidine phosphatase
MDFFLARHGEAVADLVDPSRPLSRAGREQVERVAQRAAEKGVRVSLIHHSGILRARQTAEIFASHLTPEGGLRIMTGLRPDDDPHIAAAELALAGSSVMLVGHLPHLSRLAALLLYGASGGSTNEFTPATLACYSREGSCWNLNWIIAP